MTKIISIANQKGGVAKTTTSVNLGACLAMAGYKTLLIDSDPQANATQSIIGGAIFDHGTAHLFENPKSVLSSVVNVTPIENLYLVPSDLSLSQVEWQLLKNYKSSHTMILRDKIRSLNKDNFDYVVIDCPPSLGLFSLNALMCADRVLIPIGLDIFSLVGLKYLLNTTNEIRMNGNKTLKILGIVRTMWDLRLSLAKELTESLESDYPDKLLKSIIRNTVRIRESIISQMPIVISEPSSPASEQYKELMKEVLDRW
jgi:chromosome partitioning protein